MNEDINNNVRDLHVNTDITCTGVFYTSPREIAQSLLLPSKYRQVWIDQEYRVPFVKYYNNIHSMQSIVEFVQIMKDLATLPSTCTVFRCMTGMLHTSHKIVIRF